MPLLPPPSVSKARSLGLEPRTLSFIPPPAPSLPIPLSGRSGAGVLGRVTSEPVYSAYSWLQFLVLLRVYLGVGRGSMWADLGMEGGRRWFSL